MTNDSLVNALVKLRHRIDGQDVTLTQAEAQALYVGVTGRDYTPPEQGKKP